MIILNKTAYIRIILITSAAHVGDFYPMINYNQRSLTWLILDIH